jgi:hypothetical protein
MGSSRRENAVPPKKGKNPRSGEISPVSVFKLPLGHPNREISRKTDTA